jgi:regulator of sigma E protease
MSPGSFNAASRGARAATLFAGPAMNAILAVVLFALSFIAGFPAAAAYPQVTAVPAGSEAAQLGLQPGDVVIRVAGQAAYVSAIPDFDYDVLHPTGGTGGETSSLTVVRNGKMVTLPLPDALTVDKLLAGVEYAPLVDTQIIATAASSPAQLAGLQPGDVIYGINGEIANFEKPLNDIVQQNLGQEVTLQVLRDQTWQEIRLTPRENPPEGEGALGVQIGPITQLATLPVLTAFWEGVLSTLQYVVLVLQLPVMLILGQLSPAEAQLTGPVGIAQMVGDAMTATIDTGLWFPIWRLSAVLSAALAITNLLPLPALDGGRLLFILIEALRGRRINPEREGLVHMVGFMLLIGLLFYITVQDIRTDQVGIDWRMLLGR